MVEDLGAELLRGDDAAVDFAFTRTVWERIAEHLNTIDLWAEDRELCLEKLRGSLRQVSGVLSGESMHTRMIDTLVVANFIDL